MMIRLTIFLLLSLAFKFNSVAQVPAYKEAVCRKVFNDIAQAYGSSKNPPDFKLLPKGKILMYYPGERPVIEMDVAVYDLCTKFGKDSLNALAALIGHELAHHYEKHDWCSSFAYMLGSESELAKSIKKSSAEQRLTFEAQADDFGGFYGYVAGYKTYDITPRVIESLYAYYKMPEKIPGYPSKSDRKATAEKRIVELKKWATIFDAAEYLFVMKEFSAAAGMLEYLADKFPSREILNNAGVCYFFAAMEYADKKDMPFMLPVDFDPNTRLKSFGTRSGSMSDEQMAAKRTELMNKALRFFDLAIQRDPNYINAGINKACCQLMAGKTGTVTDFANELINSGSNKSNTALLSKAYTLRAIALWQSDKRDGAIKDFNQAESINTNALTRYNNEARKNLEKNAFESFVYFVYQYFSDEGKKTTSAEKPVNADTEKIDGKNARQLLPLDECSKLTLPAVDDMIMNHCAANYSGSYLIAQKGKQWSIAFANKGYAANTSQSITIGSDTQMLKEKYGEPAYVVNMLRGEYWVYQRAKIAFCIRQGKVEKWFISNSK